MAGRIFDALARKFGRRRLFKDVDNLTPGVDFGAHIRGVLPRCRVALLLIGPEWLEARDETGQRRIDLPNDWVRLECEIALATPGLDVVPVLVNGARMPRAEELPPSLRPLLLRHAAIIRRDPDFHGDVNRLAVGLKSSIQTGILDLTNLYAEERPARAHVDSRYRFRRGRRTVVGATAAMMIFLLVYYLSPHARVPESPQTAARNSATLEIATTLAPSTADRSPATQEFDDCGGAEWCPQMVWVSGGTFQMGSTFADEGPVHTVRIARFAIGQFEVTNDEWRACQASKACPSLVDDLGDGRRPVVGVSYNAIRFYLAWLSHRTGRSYRLPSEAEWEFVARARHGGYLGSDNRNTLGGEMRVGSFAPNSLGIYDLYGNVSEWTEDCYHRTYVGAPMDGSSWIAGDCTKRVVRGASWGGDPSDTLSARDTYRNSYNPNTAVIGIGFRVARS